MPSTILLVRKMTPSYSLLRIFGQRRPSIPWESSTAFYDETDITSEIIGYTSPYHTASGVYCVQALISHALGDVVSQQEAIDAFVAESKEAL